tara:strand:+ start:1828 stop:2463 length:636 start_codon:yes stop_codon:yes gene_type:complete
MIEVPSSELMISAGVGFVLGYLVRTAIYRSKAPRKGQSFTKKQLQRWLVNDNWADIMLRRDREAFANLKLEDLRKSQKKAEKKIETLRDKQDVNLQDLQDIISAVKNAKSILEEKTIMTRVSTMSSKNSTIRHAMDQANNDLITFQQNEYFLESILADMSMAQIVGKMDLKDTRSVIDNNDGLAYDVIFAEWESLGSDKDFSKLQSILAER